VDNKENIFGRRLQLTAVEYGNTKQFKDWTPPCSDEKLRELGFEAWLLDCVTGPEPVLNMLCHSQKIHALVCSLSFELISRQ
jgi:structural maintenance of chromosomes protein 5